MATDPYGQGVTWLDYTDKPDLKVMGDNMAIPLTRQSNCVFQNASERDATTTAPVAGQEAWLIDQGLKTLYDGTTWQTVVVATLPWANVQLASGYQAWVGNTVGPRVRREGSIVYLEGRLMTTSGDNIPVSDSLVLGTIPAAYQPVGHYAEGFVSISNAGSGPPLARIEIWHKTASTGPGTIRYFSDKPTQWVGFSSWWFIN